MDTKTDRREDNKMKQIVIALTENQNDQNKKMQVMSVKLDSDCATDAIIELAKRISQSAAECLGGKDSVVDYIVYNDELRVASGTI